MNINCEFVSEDGNGCQQVVPCLVDLKSKMIELIVDIEDSHNSVLSFLLYKNEQIPVQESQAGLFVTSEGIDQLKSIYA